MSVIQLLMDASNLIVQSCYTLAILTISGNDMFFT